MSVHPFYRSRSYKDTGVGGWLVRCPKRGDMAAMRCVEYQRRDGCGQSCQSKADDGTVAALVAMRNSTPAAPVIVSPPSVPQQTPAELADDIEIL